jgi:hypothetical protein
MKGILYAKIKVSPSQIIHIFNLHTQCNADRPNEKNEFFNSLLRNKQMSQSKKFVEKTLSKHFEKGDMAYILGDFNVDGNFEKFPMNEILNFFERSPFEDNRNLKTNEYFLLKQIFNSMNNFQIFNCFEKDDPDFPHTFGDYHIHENNVVTLEKTLTHVREQNTGQCLDYIFEIKEKNEKKDLAKKDRILNNPSETNKRSHYAQVNRFQIKEQPFEQLSDHNAVELKILID